MTAVYPSLNAEQQSVVELGAEVSGVVVGAPGSGKTIALIERFIALVERGLTPDQILVIAGDRRSASALRDTIALRLGTTTEGPVARTTASIAFDIVQTQLGRAITLLTGAEHDTVISELLSGEIEDDTDGYWPDTFSRELRALAAFRAELREFIMRTEEFGVSTAQLSALASERKRPEWAAVASFIDRAVTPQSAAHLDQFDAAELSAFAARLVHDGAVLSGHEQLRVVLVDDAQDATEATISLLRAFSQRGIAVLAFGDPDIASNGFRGGRSDLIGDFATAIGRAGSTVVLHENFRLPSRIRAEFARVAEVVGVRKAAERRRPAPGAVAANEFDADDPSWQRLLSQSAYTEARVIADEIRGRHLLDDVPWSEIAVVTRSTHQALQLERSLGRMGVPTQRTMSRMLLRDNASANWLLHAAQLAYEFNDTERFDSARRREQLFEALLSPLGGFDQIELRRFKLELRAANIDLVSAIRHPNEFDDAPSRLATRAADLARTLNQAAAAARTGSVEDVLWLLWSHSPVARIWERLAGDRGALADEANASLDAVVAVFAAAKRFVERRPNESGRVFLLEQFTMAVPEDVIVGARATETVTVATPSQLLGRQFNTVVVAGLNDGVWPNLRPRFSMLHADELVMAVQGVAAPSSAAAARTEVRDDEYRLFALAISRASERVILSAQQGDETKPSVLFGSTEGVTPSARKPSRLRDLAAELRRQLVRAASSGQINSAAAQQTAAALATLAVNGAPGAALDDWYGLRASSTTAPVCDPVADGRPIKVSPSAIEKLEKSSLAWFVDQFAPAPTGDAQALGIIVHSAFEQLADVPAATPADYLELIIPELDKLPVEAEWMRVKTSRNVNDMVNKLVGYVTEATNSGRSVVGAELAFKISDEQTLVSGIIDRVERTADGKIFVVDLKTGASTPSVPEAEQNAQMQCYQLAVARGVVDGLEGPSELAGATLLYVRGSSLGPTLRSQKALSPEDAQVVEQRISHAAALMSASQFTDFAEIDSRGPAGNRRYRMQVTPAVSSS